MSENQNAEKAHKESARPKIIAHSDILTLQDDVFAESRPIGIFDSNYQQQTRRFDSTFYDKIFKKVESDNELRIKP